MERDEALKAIIDRCSALGHDMGDWGVETVEGFDYLKSTCKRDRATVLAELDGRLVSQSSALSARCVAPAPTA